MSGGKRRAYSWEYLTGCTRIASNGLATCKLVERRQLCLPLNVFSSSRRRCRRSVMIPAHAIRQFAFNRHLPMRGSCTCRRCRVMLKFSSPSDCEPMWLFVWGSSYYRVAKSIIGPMHFPELLLMLFSYKPCRLHNSRLGFFLHVVARWNWILYVSIGKFAWDTCNYICKHSSFYSFTLKDNL